ncbi:MAG: GDP-mannose 4,6-dehydratase [Chloroflexota bacterium]
MVAARALILGVDGQDGSYLAELLVHQGYQVIGWIPKSIDTSLENIRHVLERITLVKGELGDQQDLIDCLEEHRPDEIYNLAAPSSPVASWNDAVMVGDVAGLGVARLLEGMRLVCPNSRFYQASSSELFGEPVEAPQSETTPFHPRNPYGIAKLYAHWTTMRYRQHYGLFTAAGILFNHESPRRDLRFVTRKITRRAAQIKLGLEHELRLGNLDARRDWGFAGDYVRAMWLMLQQKSPGDYVVGTGETHSVRELCELAFAFLGMDYRDYVMVDESYVRPSETVQLVADSTKARRELGWKPDLTFEQLINLMVEADLRGLSAEQR